MESRVRIISSDHRGQCLYELGICIHAPDDFGVSIGDVVVTAHIVGIPASSILSANDGVPFTVARLTTRRQ